MVANSNSPIRVIEPLRMVVLGLNKSCNLKIKLYCLMDSINLKFRWWSLQLEDESHLNICTRTILEYLRLLKRLGTSIPARSTVISTKPRINLLITLSAKNNPKEVTRIVFKHMRKKFSID